MNRWILVLVMCLALVSTAYGQAVKEVTSAVKDKAVGTAKERATEKATAYVDDAAITADVKMKLADTPSLKDANISVKTSGGVVTLTGTVKNKQVKGVATRMAKSVKGVKAVDNQLTIAQPEKKAAEKKAPEKKATKPAAEKK
ncbi:MAG: BON domain-containing protein [Syntrophales bacterium]|nr:BON domain-containing protein [Syntrophales bacterium]